MGLAPRLLVLATHLWCCSLTRCAPSRLCAPASRWHSRCTWVLAPPLPVLFPHAPRRCRGCGAPRGRCGLIHVVGGLLWVVYAASTQSVWVTSVSSAMLLSGCPRRGVDGPTPGLASLLPIALVAGVASHQLRVTFTPFGYPPPTARNPLGSSPRCSLGVRRGCPRLFGVDSCLDLRGLNPCARATSSLPPLLRGVLLCLMSSGTFFSCRSSLWPSRSTHWPHPCRSIGGCGGLFGIDVGITLVSTPLLHAKPFSIPFFGCAPPPSATSVLWVQSASMGMFLIALDTALASTLPVVLCGMFSPPACLASLRGGIHSLPTAHSVHHLTNSGWSTSSPCLGHW